MTHQGKISRSLMPMSIRLSMRSSMENQYWLIGIGGLMSLSWTFRTCPRSLLPMRVILYWRNIMSKLLRTSRIVIWEIPSLLVSRRNRQNHKLTTFKTLQQKPILMKNSTKNSTCNKPSKSAPTSKNNSSTKASSNSQTPTKSSTPSSPSSTTSKNKKKYLFI